MSLFDKLKQLQEDNVRLTKENKKLKEENKTLKDKIEFLTNCLDDRDKSIEIMKEELEKLKR